MSVHTMVINTALTLNISHEQARNFLYKRGELSESTKKKLSFACYIPSDNYKDNKEFWKSLEISEHLFKTILRHRNSK